MRKVVTIGEGDTFSFKTQSGQKYAAKTRCQVTYKTGPSCPSIQFSCSEFDLDSKKANCNGGDKMTVVADGKNEKSVYFIVILFYITFDPGFVKPHHPM